MNWHAYLQLTEDIIQKKFTASPYDDEHFYEYVKLNQSRTNRWLKNGVLQADLVEALKKITEPQQWILITEPWCGDGAHLTPFIYLMHLVNPTNIELQIQLRDSDSVIDQYLTNGGKAIPKLVIRNRNGDDMWVWGPRPQAAQDFFEEKKSAGFTLDEQKIALQQWYNTDKGNKIQEEFLSFFCKK